MAEISTSCLLISAQVQFVSDSSPAQPQVSIRRFTRTSKGPVIQQSVSLPDHSQRSTLAEFHVPPNLTPQVLIEDNFSELVEIVEEVNQPNQQSSDPVKDCVQQEIAPLVNAPVSGVLPCSSGSAPVASPSEKGEVKPRDTPTKGTVANKGSPFTRFISTANLDKDKPQNKDKDKVSPIPLLPPNQESPKDTGENRLERLLSEAAEEASARIRAKSILSGSGDHPTPVASTMPKKVLKQTTLLSKKAATSVEAVQTPPEKINPVSRLEPTMSDNGPQGSEKTRIKQKRKRSPSSTDSSNDSDLEYSSSDGSAIIDEKPIKAQKKREKNKPVGKRAKPRHTLAGWMYHKYPILKYFVTTPADAARYPHKYRCRVCLVELSLMTKRPLEILSHYRTDAHLVKEHRIRMETPGLPLYDKYRNELTGMALKYAKERAKREYPITPKLGDYYLRVGQLEAPQETGTKQLDKETHSQLTLLKTGLIHGGNLDVLIALWHDLVQETKTTEPISQYDWQPHRVLVGIVSFIN